MNARFQTEIMDIVGRRLRKAREEAGFKTAKDFAEALGVDPARYRHCERGTVQPYFATLVRITQLLEVELAELIPHAYRKRDRT